MESFSYGSLFSGIGGVDLGLDRAGFTCKWQVENNAHAIRVLEKHWPEVPRYDDVKTFDGGASVDLIAGGFPCQDISNAANNRSGLDGERSGLWWQMLRIIDRNKPPFVLIENVSRLLRMGFGTILRELSERGYDAEWQTLRASQFGYPHKRARLFIVAYPNGVEWRARSNNETRMELGSRHEFNASAIQCASGWDLQRWTFAAYEALGFSPSNSATSGSVDGIPNRLDRIRGCGNAVVPDIAEFIGRRLIPMIRQFKEKPPAS